VWEKENIPYTVRKKRQAFFSEIEIQKTGKVYPQYSGHFDSLG
jgi:hypothetical protein